MVRGSGPDLYLARRSKTCNVSFSPVSLYVREQRGGGPVEHGERASVPRPNPARGGGIALGALKSASGGLGLVLTRHEEEDAVCVCEHRRCHRDAWDQWL